MTKYDLLQEITKLYKETLSIAHYNWKGIEEVCKESTTEEAAMVCIQAAIAVRKDNSILTNSGENQ